ncbi:hypothetical protein CF326_g9258, partial [Tilletia indica]
IKTHVRALTVFNLPPTGQQLSTSSTSSSSTCAGTYESANIGAPKPVGAQPFSPMQAAQVAASPVSPSVDSLRQQTAGRGAAAIPSSVAAIPCQVTEKLHTPCYGSLPQGLRWRTAKHGQYELAIYTLEIQPAQLDEHGRIERQALRSSATFSGHTTESVSAMLLGWPATDISRDNPFSCS